MRSLIDRIRLNVPWPGQSAAATSPALPSPGKQEGIRYVLADEDNEARARTLISLLGDMPPNIAEVLDAVSSACRANEEFPVIIMSELRPDLIAVSTTPIEFLPSRRHLRQLRDDEYRRYLRRRWALVLAKWNFASEIELSLSFDDFLATQLATSMPSIAEAYASPTHAQARHEAAHLLEPKTQAAR